MDAKLKKEYLKDNEVDDFIQSLYEDEDAFVDLKFKGKLFQFKTRFPASILSKYENLPKEEQLYKMIALLSSKPKIIESQSRRLPQDLLVKIQGTLEPYLDIEKLKEKKS